MEYNLLSCSAEQVRIPPFQRFWVRTVANNPSLGVPETSYLSGPKSGYLKNLDEYLQLISMNITKQDQSFEGNLRILFTELAVQGLDRFDGLKLSASGLSEKWLSFYSIDNDENKLSFQSLPVSGLLNQTLRIPLDIQTTESGRFLLDWTLPSTYIFSGITAFVIIRPIKFWNCTMGEPINFQWKKVNQILLN